MFPSHDLCGLPIIASDVGLIGHEIEAEYVYKPGDAAGLLQILSMIYLDKVSRRVNIIEGIGDWKKYSKDVTNFIKRCSNGKN